ncbi:glycosyltransferase family 4 protein [Nodosilinea sp. E11]|uniref:glycosyltransferase family 4 protein n=1 Tax=Nodosilinea sp. E11 TaxID=3037479 RepID=UPI00293441E9|nr:glycosyltransferase family 4 protein [Nodosilinea sp. E11]WOD41516.1 glycosyltransferase family 4 protein [Nodosilinea sp. E11]
MLRLAIITSHPIQYYAPWFQHLSATTDLTLRVFYLWDFGITQQADRQFNQAIQWDIPLLEGYDHEFVSNTSQRPGTSHFWGLQNPTLMAQVQSFQPDAVLLMNYNYASLYRFLWSWRDTPLLFRGDSHRLVPEVGVKAALKRQWITQLYQRFDACLYVGQANREYFRYHGVADERLFFSPHAIDNHRFMAQAPAADREAAEWKRDLGIPADHQVILFAGKLIPKKRPLDLLQAFLRADLPKVSLLFVGSGSLEEAVRQQAQASGHAHIYFAPFQNQSQMPRTYAAGDVLVLPSYGSGETWGLAINEAMCLGTPVIVSDQVGCAADLVKPGETGLVFPAGDVDALTNCLKQAFSDSSQPLQRWGKAGQHHIQHYSYGAAASGLWRALAAQNNGWQRELQQLISVY